MSYQPHNWVSNEIITKSGLNHIENGIFDEFNRAAQVESDLYQMIGDEISRAGNAESRISGNVAQNTSDITILNGNSSIPGSVDYKIANASVGTVSDEQWAQILAILYS